MTHPTLGFGVVMRMACEAMFSAFSMKGLAVMGLNDLDRWMPRIRHVKGPPNWGYWRVSLSKPILVCC